MPLLRVHKVLIALSGLISAANSEACATQEEMKMRFSQGRPDLFSRRIRSSQNQPVNRAGVGFIVLAVVLSAFQKSQFRLFGNLFIADVAIALIVFRGFFGRHQVSFRVPFLLKNGVFFIALGLVIGSVSHGVPFQLGVILNLSADILPPLAFIGLLRTQPLGNSRVNFVVASAALTAALVAVELIRSGQTTRGVATFENPNYAGNFIVAFLFLSLSAMHAKEKFIFWEFVVLIFGAVAILRTGSFGAIIALGTGLAYLSWTRLSYVFPRVRRGILVLVLLALALIAVQSSRSITQTQFDLGSGTNSKRLERSSTTRVEVWANSVQLWFEHPLGIGYSKSLPGGSLRQYLSAGESHNDFITMLVRGGLFAPIGEMLVVYSLWKLLPRASFSRAILVSWLAAGLFRQVWNFRHFWICLAVAYLVEERALLKERRASDRLVRVDGKPNGRFLDGAQLPTGRA